MHESAFVLDFTFAGEISVCASVSLSEMGKKVFMCITGA